MPENDVSLWFLRAKIVRNHHMMVYLSPGNPRNIGIAHKTPGFSVKEPIFQKTVLTDISPKRPKN